MSENKNKQNYKRIAISCAKVISFILVFVIILEALSLTVFSKNNATKYKNKFQNAYNYVNEVDNSIDIIALGNSNLYSCFCPLKLWDKRGYTSTVIASPRQTVSMSYTMLTEVLRKQSPKMVILDAGMIYEGVELTFDDDKKKTDRLPVIPYINDNQLTNDIQNHFTVFQLHDNWKRLSSNPKDKGAETNYNHGFYFNKKIKRTVPNKNMNYTDSVSEFPQDSKVYLDKTVALCKSKGIKLMLINAPSLNEWSYARHNGVKEFAQSNNADYIDFNTLDDYEINYDKDFRDKGFHMNYYGAKKITNYIGKYINNTYPDLIEDKRENADYSYWNDDKEKFIKNNKIKVF